ncbi:hypothetical protein CANARDRAFT_24495 [[Candida] arabinofermentans NRRL YB-2248]|uniref:DASH complex subunit ASK1 n=1 Tax=[Candida] arabinofermentans NRRL YB-2248 TaxID=983967 RepID=A0A1E4SX49_9ASCO|nr:hypothetical protein CANARDRAFT_24495 [[Candida] arabinofermentans NRRL YB-2248]
MSSRRSFYFSSSNNPSSTLEEITNIEQEITLTLQQIDKNLSLSNSTIQHKIIPKLSKLQSNSSKIWSNISFWKFFFENSANVQITTEKLDSDELEIEEQQQEDSIMSSVIQEDNHELNSMYRSNISLDEDTAQFRKRSHSSTPNRRPKVQKQQQQQQQQQHPSSSISEGDEVDSDLLFNPQILQSQALSLQNTHQETIIPKKWKITNNQQDNTDTTTVSTNIVQQLSPIRRRPINTPSPKKKTISEMYDSSPFDFQPPKLTNMNPTSNNNTITLTRIPKLSKDDSMMRFPNSPKYNPHFNDNNANTTTIENDYTNDSSSFRTAPLHMVSDVGIAMEKQAADTNTEIPINIGGKYDSSDSELEQIRVVDNGGDMPSSPIQADEPVRKDKEDNPFLE